MNVFEAFNAMANGHIVKDYDGVWYKNDNGILVESFDLGKTWTEVEELIYGGVNINWELIEM